MSSPYEVIWKSGRVGVSLDGELGRLVVRKDKKGKGRRSESSKSQSELSSVPFFPL